MTVKISKIQKIIFVVIILSAIVTRFYNFSERINFSLEPAVSMTVSAQYIKEKFSLLGMPSVRRTTSHGHIIYFGPWFNYLLVPMMLISKYDPVKVTAFFALLNLTTGVLIFLFVSKIWNPIVGLFSSTLFLFNGIMINNALFLWIVDYLPLIGILSFAAFYYWYIRRQSYFVLFLGLLSGVAFNLEYLYFPTLLIVWAVLLFFSKEKVKDFVIFLGGALLGNLPTIIFDLRHNFYHIKTIWQYFLDTISFPSQAAIQYHVFLQFWPILAVLGGLAIYWIYLRSKYSAIVLLIIYLYISFTSSWVSFSGPVGMSGNLNYPKLEKVAKVISLDKPSDFNLVEDYNPRAQELRYIVTYIYGIRPMGVEEYGTANILYALVPQGYNFFGPTPWEISVFQAKNIQKIYPVDKTYALYKLTK